MASLGKEKNVLRRKINLSSKNVIQNDLHDIFTGFCYTKNTKILHASGEYTKTTRVNGKTTDPKEWL